MNINELIQEVAEMIGNHTKMGQSGIVCSMSKVEEIVGNCDAYDKIGDHIDGVSTFYPEDVAFCFIECVRQCELLANTEVMNGCEERINVYQESEIKIGGTING